MGANNGKDKSVATFFLKRENGDKVPLVIKCDKKDLEKLSLLIVSEAEEDTQGSTSTSSIPTEVNEVKRAHGCWYLNSRRI